MKQLTSPSQQNHFWHSSQQSAIAEHRSMAWSYAMDDEPELSTAPRGTWWGTLLMRSATFVCLLTILGAALYHIWAQSQAIQLGFEYSRMIRQYKSLKAENFKLGLSVARLRDLQRLHRIARQELGMQQPPSSHVLSEVQVKQMLRTSPSQPRLRLARAKTRNTLPQ